MWFNKFIFILKKQILLYYDSTFKRFNILINQLHDNITNF